MIIDTEHIALGSHTFNVRFSLSLSFSHFSHLILEETSSSSSPPQLKTTPSNGEKVSQKKSRKNRSKKIPSMAKSYEHHLEKWLENSSNFNVDENVIGGSTKEGWPLHAANAAPKQQQQQRPANRRKGQTQQHQPFDVVNDAILFVSWNKRAASVRRQPQSTTLFSSLLFFLTS